MVLQVNNNTQYISQLKAQANALESSPTLTPKETQELQAILLDLQNLQNLLSKLTPALANDPNYQSMVHDALYALTSDLQGAQFDFQTNGNEAYFASLTAPIYQVLNFQPAHESVSFGGSINDSNALNQYLTNFSKDSSFFNTFILGGISTEIQALQFVSPTAK